MKSKITKPKFKNGDHVVVTKPGLDSYLKTGVVIGSGCSGCYVGFINWKNTGLEKTLYISNCNLKIGDKITEVEPMAAVTGNYNVATVKFLTGYNTDKEYIFALFDNNVVVGDCVVCDTKDYSVARVVNIQPKGDELPTKEIICKADFSDFVKRKEDRELKVKLKREMDMLISEDRDLVLYQALADKNPKMAELLNQYKSLNSRV